MGSTMSSGHIVPGRCSMVMRRACCCWSSLLIFVAFLLYADRKIWAAVQMRRGPNVVGPFGPAAVLRRPLQVRAQGAGHPGGRRQGRLPAGAAGHLPRWRSAPGR